MGERCVNNLTPGNLPVWPPASSFLFPPIQVSFLFLPKSSNSNESTENVIFSLSNYSLPCLMLQLTNTVDSLRGGTSDHAQWRPFYCQLQNLCGVVVFLISNNVNYGGSMKWGNRVWQRCRSLLMKLAAAKELKLPKTYMGHILLKIESSNHVLGFPKYFG